MHGGRDDALMPVPALVDPLPDADVPPDVEPPPDVDPPLDP